MKESVEKNEDEKKVEVITPAREGELEERRLWERHDNYTEHLEALEQEKRRAIKANAGDSAVLKRISGEYDPLIEDLTKKAKEIHAEIVGRNRNELEQNALVKDLATRFKNDTKRYQ